MSEDMPDGLADQQAIAEALYGLVTLAVRSGPREISLTAASTLATLDRTGPRRLTDLAVIEGVAQPSMTVLVTGLEKSGMVERRPGPDDKRVVLVALTPAGARYLRDRRRAGAGTFASLIGKLAPDEIDALARAIPAMNHLRDLEGAQRGAGVSGAAAGAVELVGAGGAADCRPTHDGPMVRDNERLR
jgi:DNA-binding MarR family transcriptional regulator